MARKRYTYTVVHAVSPVTPGSRESLPGIVLWFDAELMEAMMASLASAYPGRFGTSAGGASVQISGVPRISFHHRMAWNMTFTLPLKLTVAGLSMSVKATSRARLLVEAGDVKIGGLDLELDTSIPAVETVARALFDEVRESLNNVVTSFSLPVLNSVLGHDIDAEVASLEIEVIAGRPFLRVIASIGEHSCRPAHAWRPPEMQYKHPRRGQGTLMLVVPEVAIDATLRAAIPQITLRLDSELSVGPTQARLKGRITLESVDVRLREGELRTSARIRFQGLQARTGLFGVGVKIPFRVKPYTPELEFNLEQENEGRRVLLRFRGVERARLRLAGGGVFTEVLQQLMDAAIDSFTSLLSDRLSGKTVTLLNYPETLPGTNVPTRLHFVQGTPRVVDGAIVAYIHIGLSAQDESNSLTEMPGLWTSRAIRGRLVHMNAEGSGQPIVFIHDYAQSMADWDRQVNHFCDSHYTVQYSLRGMGKSNGGILPYRFGSLVQDLHVLMRELTVQGPVLCGQGLGAAVALAYARRYPQRVRAVVVVGGASELARPTLSLASRQLGYVLDVLWRDDFEDANETFIQDWLTQFAKGRAIPLLYAQLAWWFAFVPILSEGHDDTPMYVIRGKGGDAPGDWARDFELDEESRMPMVELSDAFNAALTTVLDEVEAMRLAEDGPADVDLADERKPSLTELLDRTVGAIPFPANTNIRLGWGLIGLQFLAACWVEPQYLAMTGVAEANEFFPRVFSTNAGIVVAFYLLVLGASQAIREKRLLETPRWPFPMGALGGCLLILGGTMGRQDLGAPAHAILSLACVCLMASAYAVGVSARGRGTLILKVSFSLTALGFGAELIGQVMRIDPDLAQMLVEDAGTLIQRLLRLGLAALVTLPMLTVLLRFLPAGAATSAASDSRGNRRSRFVQRGGLVGTLFVGSCVILGYLSSSSVADLPNVSQASFAMGAVGSTYVVGWAFAGVWQVVVNGAHRLEVVGWSVLLSSMLMGVPMFLIAFDVYQPTFPHAFDNYFDIDRRYLRSIHVYAMYYAVFMICAARQIGSEEVKERLTTWLLLAAFAVTELTLLLSAFGVLDPKWLWVGPALTALAMFVLCAGATRARLDGMLADLKVAQRLE